MSYKDEAFDFLGITRWHELGYKGKGIKIMSGEKIQKKAPNGTPQELWDKVICPSGYKLNKDDHGSNVMRHILAVCPEAECIALPFNVNQDGKGYKSTAVDYILENNVTIFTTSYLFPSISELKKKAMRDCIEKGCTFFVCSGNGESDINEEAKAEEYICIGGVKPRCKNGKYDWNDLYHVSYSNEGEEIDYTTIAEVLGSTGTSFFNPLTASMCVLVQEFFLEKTGRTLNRSELISFINDNLIDVEEEGFDNKTGHGLFILPSPETIKLSNYVTDMNVGDFIDYGGFPEVGGKDMKKVFIGVGHGGVDSGAVGNGVMEKDINLQIALACCDELVRHGVSVRMSRVCDENDPLTEEIKEANDYKPDLAIDIHTNSASSLADGFEAFIQAKNLNSKELAKCIEEEVIAVGQNSRGVKIQLNNAGNDYFGFLRNINHTAVIVECAFINNPTDIEIVDETEEQKAFGIAYAKGILKYLGIEYKEKEDKPMEEVSDWAKTAWQWATEKGYLDGTNPKGTVTREMLAQVLFNLFGKGDSNVG